MRLASFLLFLALPQAQAKPAAAQTYVVESTCTKESVVDTFEAIAKDFAQSYVEYTRRV